MAVQLAQFLTIKKADGTVLRQWQNHWINQTVDGHEFYPFNCSSMMSKVSSGEMSVTISLPVSTSNRDLIQNGLSQFYVVEVDQYQFLPPASGLPATKTLVASFAGEFESGSTTPTSMQVSVGANLDSTESQAPPRQFTTALAGKPPKL
jgi:hypothetical protein